MSLWVTLKDGRVKCYNNAGYYQEEHPFHVISAEKDDVKKGYSIARIRSQNIICLEWEKPCEETFVEVSLDRAVELVLLRAKKTTKPETLEYLADLKRLLRKFNPQRKVWMK